MPRPFIYESHSSHHQQEVETKPRKSYFERLQTKSSAGNHTASPPSENLHQPEIINQTIECVHFKQSVTKFQLRYWNFSAFGAPPRHPFFRRGAARFFTPGGGGALNGYRGLAGFFSGWRCSIDDQSTGPGPQKQMMMMICGGGSNKGASNRGSSRLASPSLLGSGRKNLEKNV